MAASGNAFHSSPASFVELAEALRQCSATALPDIGGRGASAHSFALGVGDALVLIVKIVGALLQLAHAGMEIVGRGARLLRFGNVMHQGDTRGRVFLLTLEELGLEGVVIAGQRVLERSDAGVSGRLGGGRARSGTSSGAFSRSLITCSRGALMTLSRRWAAILRLSNHGSAGATCSAAPLTPAPRSLPAACRPWEWPCR